MPGSFLEGLYTSFDVIGQMALLVLLGFLMVRRKWIRDETLSDLVRFLVDVVIPCTFVLAMARSFSMEILGEGLVLVLFSSSWIVLSWAAGTLLYRILPGGDPRSDRSVVAMMMISNSIYLPLPVILAITPEHMHDQAIMYISMISFPSIVFMWTLGVKLLGNAAALTTGERLKRVFNPPIVSFLFGIAISFIPGVRESAKGLEGGIAPIETLMSVLEFVSRMLSPMAMIILGGLIAGAGSIRKTPSRYVVPLVLLRLLAVPAAVYVVAANLSIQPLAATILLLVSAAPPATNHALIARRYGGKWELVSALQLAAHLAALLTLPFWLSLALNSF
ncbi:MAG: AEC family transporter [Candidatus Aegiribacteria sp.]